LPVAITLAPMGVVDAIDAIDASDGSPVLDVKPYRREFEPAGSA
jgi:tRNA (Thr-GGU) A37 N-methylase